MVIWTVLCASLPAFGYDHTPTVSEVGVLLDTYRAAERDGTIDVFPGWRAWAIAHKEAQLALTAGRLALFHDRLLKLESIGLPGDPGSAISMAELYSLAVEADVSSIVDRLSFCR